MENRSSYTSADSKPVKLINNQEVLSSIQSHGTIPPIHAQVILTNKCNLKCSFCSCAKDDRETEMPLQAVYELIDILKKCGTKAVTITGGGEPLLHPDFDKIIAYFWASEIKIGLVTNGLLLSRLKSSTLNKIKWIRVSHASDRPFNAEYKFNLSEAIGKGGFVDWAFSYVVTPDTKVLDLLPVIHFANAYRFTHVRLVADLFNPKQIDMDEYERRIKVNVNDSIVIYQPRQEPETGSDCYIGLLKPLIGADGMVYACCGVQYAFDTPSKKLPLKLSLGSFHQLERIISERKIVDGSICKRCYYGEYNRTLKEMFEFNQIDHKEFV